MLSERGLLHLAIAKKHDGERLRNQFLLLVDHRPLSSSWLRRREGDAEYVHRQGAAQGLIGPRVRYPQLLPSPCDLGRLLHSTKGARGALSVGHLRIAGHIGWAEARGNPQRTSRENPGQTEEKRTAQDAAWAQQKSSVSVACSFSSHGPSHPSSSCSAASYSSRAAFIRA